MKLCHFFKKEWIFPLLALVLALCAFSGSLAYLVAKPEPLTNRFQPGYVPVEPEEVLENGIKKDVAFTNLGNTNARMRAQVVFAWKNANGQIYPKLPIPGSDYTIQFNTADWTLARDGYWYCSADVAPGQRSPIFISRCQKADIASVPSGFDLSVQILVQAIQADSAAVSDAWPDAPANKTEVNRYA